MRKQPFKIQVTRDQLDVAERLGITKEQYFNQLAWEYYYKPKLMKKRAAWVRRRGK